LERNGELESVGGKTYLATLIDATPTAANVAYHAGIVREYSRRRQVIASATEAIALAYEGRTDAEDIAQSVTAALLPVATDSDVRGFRPIKTIVWETADEIESRSRGTSHLQSTGYPSLDAALGGGIERGALVIIGGVQKSGKSAIVHGIALNAASRGEECAIVSAEMGERQVVRRLLSSESGISSATLKTGKLADPDWLALTRSMGYVGSLPIWIYDAYGPTLADVRTRVIALKAKRPALTWVVVDYLQLVNNAMKGRRGDEELNGISRGLKALAKETDTIVVSPVQLLPKVVEERRERRPELRDVQGFSGAGQDADYVMLAYRPAMYFGDADNRLELILAASRDSAPSTVTLYFHGPMMRIVDTWQPNDA
jgi:replicative DNA helicase